MSVQKFKSLEEAEKALWNFNPDEKYFQAVSELFEVAYRLCPPDYPRGVFKYRTIEDANKDREKWILENARRKIKNLSRPNSNM